jgi:hypothetical protein
MIRFTRNVKPRDVFCQFAAAEVDSPRYGQPFESIVGQVKATRLRTTPLELWTDADCDAGVAGVTAIRGHYVRSIFALEPEWRIGSIPIQELADIRLIQLPAFASIAPRRTLFEFVRALDSGRDTQGDSFGSSYRQFRPKFDVASMRGLPILLAKSDVGPYTEVEGLTRLCCLLSMHLNGETVPDAVDVVLGISRRVESWPWY